MLLIAALLLIVIIDRLNAGIPIWLSLHPAPLGPREYGIIHILAFLHSISVTDASIGGLAGIDGSLDHDFFQYLFKVSMLSIIQGDARVDLQLVLLPVLICREVFRPVQYRGNLSMRLGRGFQIRQVLLLVLLTRGKRRVLRQIIRMSVQVRIR